MFFLDVTIWVVCWFWRTFTALLVGTHGEKPPPGRGRQTLGEEKA
jgi:hypothetical protein